MEIVGIPLDRVVEILCKYGYEKSDAPSDGKVANICLGEDSFSLRDLGNLDPQTAYEIISSNEHSILKYRQNQIFEAGGDSYNLYVDPARNQFFIIYGHAPKSGGWNDCLHLFLPIKKQFEAVGYSPEEFIKLLFTNENIKPPFDKHRRKKHRPAKTCKDWGSLWGKPGAAVPA